MPQNRAPSFELAQAGSELVRITVNTPAAAKVPTIREMLEQMGCNVPLVGDFHSTAIVCNDFPECAQALGGTD